MIRTIKTIEEFKDRRDYRNYRGYWIASIVDFYEIRESL